MYDPRAKADADLSSLAAAAHRQNEYLIDISNQLADVTSALSVLDEIKLLLQDTNSLLADIKENNQ